VVDDGHRAGVGLRGYGDIYRRGLAANVVGATVAFVWVQFISPPQPPPEHGEEFLFGVLVPVYVVIVGIVAYRIGKRHFAPVERWLADRRAPSATERDLVLGLPWRAAAGSAAGWLCAALVFGLSTATHHPALFVAGVVGGILLAGLVTTAVTFLIIERTLRPLFALALAGEVAHDSESLRTRVLRTRPRLLVSWALGSAIALVAIPLAFVGRGDSTGDELIAPVLFLVVAGLFAGGALMSAAARSVSDPVERLRGALGRVEQGSLDVTVPVDDGGEIGMLQAGFNRMVAGLREREQIRDAFGTYVDREVADHILREGTALSGEEVEVTMLFLDIRGFTGLAERLSAAEVVATLNRLFERIVPIVHAHGGHVDKYAGDGLLAVFGAPRRQDDHADQALGAALAIADAVEDEFRGDLSVGIGLNSGPVVAGNVGGAGRLEFSVIGDAVNVAARVESATRETGDVVLITQRTYDLLRDRGIALDERPDINLKGKREPVILYAPRVRAALEAAGRAADR